VSDAGLAGTVGAPELLFSTAVTDDDATDDAGDIGAGTDNDEVLLVLFATIPARSQGFGGEGMMVVGSRFCCAGVSPLCGSLWGQVFIIYFRVSVIIIPSGQMYSR
jgi:hypothetical protein